MHMCQVKDCFNAANERPSIHIWAMGYKPGQHPPAQLHIGEFWTCATCKPKVTVDDFLDPMGKARIISAFEQVGKIRPDFTTAQLVWVEG